MMIDDAVDVADDEDILMVALISITQINSLNNKLLK